MSSMTGSLRKRARRGTSASTTDGEAQPSIRCDKLWTKGDFELISSDSVRFRVPSFYLLAHSIVLRDIYKLDTTQIKTIRFYDTTFETSTVLRLFFKLVSSSNLPGSTLDRDDLINLAHFTKKWDCSTTANLRFSFIRNGLLQSYDNSVKTLKARRLVEPLTAFSVAAILGCKDICVLALEVPGQTWEQDLEDDDTMTNPMKGEPGTHPLRPAGWPMSMYGRIPVAYQLGALPHVVRVRRQP